MEIVLVRHGRPLAPRGAFLRGDAIGEWVRGYEAATVDPGAHPPSDLRSTITGASCVISSDAPRARESALQLVSPDRVIVDADFREAALPPSVGTALRLPASVWVAIARLAWHFDLVSSSEPRRDALARADRVAHRLAMLASEHGRVAVIGHGWFNRLVAASLTRRGWRSRRWCSHAHWSVARFRRLSLP